MQSHRRQLLAHVLPMVLFLALLALCQFLTARGQAFPLRHAEFSIYPAQTILCGAVLLWFRHCYEFHRLKNVVFALLIALAVFGVWVAPQYFLNFAPRAVGFNPTLLENNSAAYWSTILFRFLRLVVVVPLVEEIFWRGFLLRFVIDERFERVPFCKFNWLSFAVVTVAFAFSHSRPDWPAAFITGALYNVVAYRTQSLASCVLAHAVTNLFLGLWIMQSRQWGFW